MTQQYELCNDCCMSSRVYSSTEVWARALTATDCQTLLVIFQAVVADPLLVRGNECCQVGL